jgi:hypothetical protein
MARLRRRIHAGGGVPRRGRRTGRSGRRDAGFPLLITFAVDPPDDQRHNQGREHDR